MSSREWLLPGLLVSNHGVEDGEQFSHTSHEGKFFRFAVCEEALIERSDDRVATAGREGHPPHPGRVPWPLVGHADNTW